jgi:hypothetical protein
MTWSPKTSHPNVARWSSVAPYYSRFIVPASNLLNPSEISCAAQAWRPSVANGSEERHQTPTTPSKRRQQQTNCSQTSMCNFAYLAVCYSKLARVPPCSGPPSSKPAMAGSIQNLSSWPDCQSPGPFLRRWNIISVALPWNKIQGLCALPPCVPAGWP